MVEGPSSGAVIAKCGIFFYYNLNIRQSASTGQALRSQSEENMATRIEKIRNIASQFGSEIILLHILPNGAGIINSGRQLAGSMMAMATGTWFVPVHLFHPTGKANMSFLPGV